MPTREDPNIALITTYRVANRPVFPGTSRILTPLSRVQLTFLQDAECPVFPKNGRMA